MSKTRRRIEGSKMLIKKPKNGRMMLISMILKSKSIEKKKKKNTRR